MVILPVSSYNTFKLSCKEIRKSIYSFSILFLSARILLGKENMNEQISLFCLYLLRLTKKVLLLRYKIDMDVIKEKNRNSKISKLRKTIACFNDYIKNFLSQFLLSEKIHFVFYFRL